MGLRKILTLVGVVFFGSFGDTLLSRGMRDVGEISLANWTHLFQAFADPWVWTGMLLLGAFFTCYLTALSWADLTYVLPATSVGYVVVALLARFFLHEQVSLTRWIGILLIVAGVGFIAGGPELTHPPHEENFPPANMETHATPASTTETA